MILPASAALTTQSPTSRLPSTPAPVVDYDGHRRILRPFSVDDRSDFSIRPIRDTSCSEQQGPALQPPAWTASLAGADCAGELIRCHIVLRRPLPATNHQAARSADPKAKADGDKQHVQDRWLGLILRMRRASCACTSKGGGRECVLWDGTVCLVTPACRRSHVSPSRMRSGAQIGP